MKPNTRLAKELNGKTKIGKIFLVDLIVGIVFYFIMDGFKGLVKLNLQPFYLMFTVLVAICLILPSKSNPGKKTYHSLLYMIFFRKKIYLNMKREGI